MSAFARIHLSADTQTLQVQGQMRTGLEEGTPAYLFVQKCVAAIVAAHDDLTEAERTALREHLQAWNEGADRG